MTSTPAPLIDSKLQSAITRALAVLVVTLTAGAAASRAEMGDAATKVLKANRYVLSIKDGSLTGPGGEWLVEKAADARFTLVGESHGYVEPPLLTGALLKALRPAGYATYVVESGPVATRLLTDAIGGGGVAAGEALLTEFPFSIAFLDLREELRVAAEALAMGYAVWGIDQEFMGSAPLLLHRLSEVAREKTPREVAQAMLQRARAGAERFMITGDDSAVFMMSATEEDFDRLAASFADETGEAHDIIDQMRASAAVYHAFGEGRYYENNSTRVALMKRNLLEQMRRAADTALSQRRALFKGGAVHMGRGRNPKDVHDIGNLASELAIATGSESFHVVLRTIGPADGNGELSAWEAELANRERPVVFDLTPLRPLLTQRADLPEPFEELKELAVRYDAIVLFPRFHEADQIVPMPERE